MVRGGEVISDGLRQRTEKSEERRENRAGRRASVRGGMPVEERWCGAEK